MLVLKRNRS